MDSSGREEDAVYWRREAEQLKENYEKIREEYDEFQVGSKELELELEAQLSTAEKKNRELVNSNAKLTQEVEMLREKCDKQHLSSHRQITELETKLSKVEAYSEALQKYIRELEQTNDDLERAKRAAVTSLEDFEARLNQAIERNAFLESELDEKEDLVVTIQRMKDEARDRRQELAVQSIRVTGSETSAGDQASISTSTTSFCEDLAGGGAVGGSKNVSNVSVMTEMTPQPRSGKPLFLDSPSLTPGAAATTRISALNIVGDLLRKVASLESRMSTCRSVVYTTSLQQPHPAGTVPSLTGVDRSGPAFIAGGGVGWDKITLYAAQQNAVNPLSLKRLNVGEPASSSAAAMSPRTCVQITV